jgi:DNA-binding MarR family transcriptional regulator
MLIAIRRVIRAVDLHSRHLSQSHDLTGPQALLLRELAAAGELAPSDLARRVSLSQATVTDIVKRLERRQLLSRLQDHSDRRRVRLQLTESGKALQARSPPLLQDTFVNRFAALQAWEQHMLLSTMQRIAALMDAHTLDAEPLLSNEPLDPDVPAGRRRPGGDPSDASGVPSRK